MFFLNSSYDVANAHPRQATLRLTYSMFRPPADAELLPLAKRALEVPSQLPLSHYDAVSICIMLSCAQDPVACHLESSGTDVDDACKMLRELVRLAFEAQV
jgi:hypothetical protein